MNGPNQTPVRERPPSNCNVTAESAKYNLHSSRIISSVVEQTGNYSMAACIQSWLSESRSRWLDQSAESELFLMAHEFARNVAESACGQARRTLAEEFCLTTIAAYWRALQRQYRQPWTLPPLLSRRASATLERTVIGTAQRIGTAAADLDHATASYLIGRNYTAMLPADVRSKLGVYYTPPLLVARLIDAATAAGVNWRQATITDPACGGGAFLAPVAAKIVTEMPDADPRTVIRGVADRLRGFEVDSFAAWMSQVFVEVAMLPVCRDVGLRLPTIVEVCDSLDRHAPTNRFDVVIGNPPYGRVTLPAEARARYRRSLYGHANLYGLFTDLALRLVRPGGVVAYVTPASFLAGEYFKRLRGLLGREAPPVNIDFVAARKGVFDDVLQETVLATYRHEGKCGDATVHLVDFRAGAIDIASAGRNRRGAAMADTTDADPDGSRAKTGRFLPLSVGLWLWSEHRAVGVEPTQAAALQRTKQRRAAADLGRKRWRKRRIRVQGHEAQSRAILQAGGWRRVAAQPAALRTAAADDRKGAGPSARRSGIAGELHRGTWRGGDRKPSQYDPATQRRAGRRAERVGGIPELPGRRPGLSLRERQRRSIELESLPLPPPSALREFSALVMRGATRAQLDVACASLFKMVETA